MITIGEVIVTVEPETGGEAAQPPAGRAQAPSAADQRRKVLAEFARHTRNQRRLKAT